MEPTQQLIDALWLDKVEAARQMSAESKLLAGGELYDELIVRMLSGIRNQFPAYTDDQVLTELRRRLAIQEHIENNPWRATGS